MKRSMLALSLAVLISCGVGPTRAKPPTSSEATDATRIDLPTGFSYPNGITATPDGTLFVGSTTTGTILRIQPDGSSSVLLEGSDALFAGTALEYDAETGLLWVSSPDFLGTEVNGQKVHRPHRVAVVDPTAATVLWSTEVPESGFINDIALDGSGGVYLTDSTLGCVWHLPKPGAAFERFADSPLLKSAGIGPAGIARGPDGTLFVGLYDKGTLVRISEKGHVTKLATSATLHNPDGLELSDDGRLLVVEGAVDSGRGRVLAVDLETPAPHRVEVLAEALDTPVNLVRAGSEAIVSESRVRHHMRPELGLRAPKAWQLARVPIPAPMRTTRAIARLPEEFFPESIATDAYGQFYLGSATRSEILRVSASGTPEVWIPSGVGGLMSVQGLLVASDRLYACTGDLGKHATPTGPSAVLAFELQTSSVQGRWPLTDGGFCNDMAQLPDGSLLITDTMGARLWRFDPAQELAPEVWLADARLGGANGITTSSDGSNVFVSTFSDGRILRIGLEAPRSVTELALSRPLDGGDALRMTPDGRLVVFENGVPHGTGRLTQIELSGNEAELTTILATTAGPTSGVIVGSDVVWGASNFRILFGGDTSAFYDRGLYRTTLP